MKEIYINLHQMKICMDHRLKLKRQSAHLDELYYYPETGSPTLKAAISKHLNVDQSRILFG